VYRIQFPGGMMDILLSQIPSGMNYDLILSRMVNGEVQLVATSFNPGNSNEYLNFGPVSPGVYYIGVQTVTQGSTAPYRVEWNWAPKTP
jgi:hypothetical protein